MRDAAHQWQANGGRETNETGGAECPGGKTRGLERFLSCLRVRGNPTWETDRRGDSIYKQNETKKTPTQTSAHAVASRGRFPLATAAAAAATAAMVPRDV